jgi:predicted permease
LKRIFRALLRSVPFVTYLIMLLTNLIRIPVPSFILSVAGIGSNANAFMAMLMIGVGFNLSADRSRLGAMARILGARYSIAAILALALIIGTKKFLKKTQSEVTTHAEN